MKPIVFLLFFALSFCFSGCEKCGDDVFVNALLTENSKTWMIDPDQLVYSNLNGEILTFNLEESLDQRREIALHICGSGGSYGGGALGLGGGDDNSYEVTSVEYRRRTYKVEGREISFTLQVAPDSPWYDGYNAAPDDPFMLYDYILYSLVTDNSDPEFKYFDFPIITDDRGNPPCTLCHMQNQSVPSQANKLNINGKVFKDVYSIESAFYVTKELGIIAFTDPDGTVWSIVE